MKDDDLRGDVGREDEDMFDDDNDECAMTMTTTTPRLSINIMVDERLTSNLKQLGSHILCQMNRPFL